MAQQKSQTFQMEGQGGTGVRGMTLPNSGWYLLAIISQGLCGIHSRGDYRVTIHR